MKENQYEIVNKESEEALKIVFDRQIKLEDIPKEYGHKDLLFRRMLEGMCMIRDADGLNKEQFIERVNNLNPLELP